MSITVADCMRLPALREAKVIAGHGGLGQAVSAVSVLEYARISALAGVLFSGNELILSAFTSVSDSVEEQCFAIKRLHEVGEVGLVLYYVGYFLPNVDPKLTALADQLDFPLILMPPNTYYHRYSDVITEVLNAVFEDRRKDSRFVSELLERASRLSERQRTIPSVLRLISDRLRCSLLLLDCDGRERGLASWPLAATEEYISAFRGAADSLRGESGKISWQDTEYRIKKRTFDTDQQHNLSLFFLENGSALPAGDIEQAIEVLRVFCNVWKRSVQYEGADDLVRAILNNQQPSITRLADQLHVDLKKIRVMWVLRMKEGRRPLSALFNISELKIFLRENGKRAFVDAFDNSVVAFMEDSDILDEDWLLAQQFMDLYRREQAGLALIWCGGMDSIRDVQQAYMLSESCFSAVSRIYPRKDSFTLRELAFARECLRILELPRAQAGTYLSALSPLCGQKDEEVLLQTLSSYLIDSDADITKTGAALYVHDGTVKYRLNKAQQRLGYSISQMPGTYSLYLALALRRLQQ